MKSLNWRLAGRGRLLHYVHEDIVRVPTSTPQTREVILVTRIFISHSHADKSFATLLAQALRERGFEPWIDHEGIRGGARWSTSIQEGLDSCKALVLVLSAAAMESSNVEDEWQYALDEGTPIVPVRVEPTRVHFQLKRIQHVDFREREFEEAVRELERSLRSAMADVALASEPRNADSDERVPSDDQTPCPYRGLHAFREEDAPFFFGREVFAERLVDTLGAKPMVGVIGPSGSGKSSVVFAGMLPRLREANGPSGGWTVLQLRPGAEPFHALASVLVPLLEGADSRTDRLIAIRKMTDALAVGTLNVGHVLADVRGERADLGAVLFVVDQFEELYTLCPDTAVQRRFQDLIFETAFGADGSGPVRLALTLRADFMGHATAYRPFSDAIQDHNVILGPMNADELTRVIARPAELLGRAFEPGLVERIRRDVGEEAGSLPLLEFALTKLWEGQVGGRLTHATYEALGQVEGAVARHADAVYDGLSDADQHLARKVVVQMVRPGEGTEDTRRVARREELGDEGWGLVRRLADARLVVTNRDEAGNETAEVVHEALIRTWGRLKEWMGEDRRFRMWQERLRFAIRQWEAAGRDDGALLRGVPLAEAEQRLEQRESELTGLEREFVVTALKARTRRQQRIEARRARERALEQRGHRLLRIVAAVSVAAAILGAVMSAFVWNARQSERRQAEIARSLALAAESRRLLAEGDSETAIALALAASDIENPPSDVQRALAESALTPGLRDVTGPFSTVVRAIALTHDGHHLLMAPTESQLENGEWNTELGVRVHDLETLKEIARLEDVGVQIDGLSVSDDGRWIAGVNGISATVFLWVADEGALAASWSSGVRSAEVAFLPGSQQVAVGNSIMRVPDGEPVTQLFEIADHLGVTSIDAAGDAVAFYTFTDDVSRVFSIAERKQLWSKADHYYATMVDRDAVLVMVVGGLEIHNFREDKSRRIDLPASVEAYSIDLSPDGSLAAIGTVEGEVLLIGLESGEMVRRYRGHRGIVTAVLFDPRGERLISTSHDRTVRVWDIEHGALLSRIRDPSGQGELAWCQGGERLITYRAASEDIVTSTWRVEIVAPDDPRLGSELKAVELESRDDRLPWPSLDIDTLQHRSSRLLAVDSQGGLVAMASNTFGERDLTVFDVHRGTELWRAPNPHYGTSMWALTFSPDGQRVYTGGWDDRLLVWDAHRGDILDAFAFEEPVERATVFPDGKRIAFSHPQSYELLIVELESGAVLHVLEGHTARIETRPAISADGRMMITGAADRTAILWDVETGALIKRLVGHTAGVVHADFSPDGQIALTSAADGTIRLWNVHTGLEIHKLPGGHDAFFRADGQAVLARSPDGDAIEEWTIQTDPAVIAAWVAQNRHVPRLGCAQRTRFGLVEACSEEDEEALPQPRPSISPAGLWERRGGVDAWAATAVVVPSTPTPIPATPATSRQARLGTQSGLLTVGSADRWTLALDRPQGVQIAMRAVDEHEDTDEAESATQSNGGLDPQLIVRGSGGEILAVSEDVSGSDDMSAKVVLRTADGLDVLAIEARSHRDRTAGAYTLELLPLMPEHPKGLRAGSTVRNLAMVPGTVTALAGDYAGDVHRVNLSTGEVLWRYRNRFDAICAVAVDASEGLAAVGFGAGRVAMLGLDDGVERLTFDIGARVVRSLAFMPDRPEWVLGASGEEISIWNVATGDEVQRFEGHEAEVLTIAISPDGSRLLSGSRGGGLRLWNLESGDPIWVLETQAANIWSVAFGPNGDAFYSASGDELGTEPADILAWRLEPPEVVGRLDGHSEAVMAIAASADGRWLASASLDESVRLWDLATMREVGRGAGHPGGAVSVDLSLEHSVIVSGGWDAHARVYDIGEWTSGTGEIEFMPAPTRDLAP